MSDEPESFTLALLHKIDAKVDKLSDELRSQITDVKSDVRSLRADVASDLLTLEKRLEKRFDDQIGGLRRAVIEYHSSQIGHGALLTEFEERLRRLEKHLGLSPEGH